MPLQDYTLNAPDGPGPIIRGSVWPAAGDPRPVEITNAEGWPPGADGWTWKLVLSRTRRGGTPDLVVEADTVTLVGDLMLLLFRLTAPETEALPVGKGRFFVEVLSEVAPGTTTPGSPEVGPSYYDCVSGTANVRDAAGEG